MQEDSIVPAVQSQHQAQHQNTWRGTAIIVWRVIKMLVAPPSPEGLSFATSGSTAVGEISCEFDAPPDHVWAVVWSSSHLQSPHRSIDDIREGEIFTMYSDMTEGRGLFWTKNVARCEAITPGRRLYLRLISQDGDESERISEMLGEYIVEPLGHGTRLTIRVADEQGATQVMFKRLLTTALNWNMARIRADLQSS
jgi:hypothetical protein